MSNKGSTPIVGYIAMLMIAGAALGHDAGTGVVDPLSFQTNALAFREVAATDFSVPAPPRRVRIQIEGRTYDATLIDDVSPASEQLKFSSY